VDNDVLLQVESLSQSFGGLQAVDQASLEIRSGEFVGLIGPNGAGKSTLIDCLSGHITGYRGKVTFDGADISHLAMHKVARRGLARTFQVSRVFDRLTATSNLLLAPQDQRGETVVGALLGRWRQEEREHIREAGEALAEFDLTRIADSFAGEVSGGQRRLIELSRALLMRPKMLLLDEPFAGVSPANRRILGDWLVALNRESGMTILMVEHRLEEVERLCSRAIVMAAGRPIAQGSLTDLRADKEVVSAYFGG
jgi:branched-chain amino acid transport system ATP-binding protein